MKSLFTISIFTLALIGCSSAQVADPVVSTVPVNTELKRVEEAIIHGAKMRNWIPKATGSNSMELSLHNRSHMVIVDVHFTPQNYTITYKDSSNMAYDSSSKTIHKKYARWIASLRAAIDKSLVR